jgi:hypothetical protein
MLNRKDAAHVHEDDLDLYLRGRLEPGRIPPVESHLADCDICHEILSDCLGLRLDFLPTLETPSGAAPKRTEPRFNVEGEGTLHELHPLSLNRQKIKIVNVSKNLLGILSPKAIYPGTIVQLRIKDTVELANVWYCSASADGFRVGLWLHAR